MKKHAKITFYSCLGIILFLAFSCKKQELAVENPPNVIDLFVNGTTLTDTLEFLKDGKIIGQTENVHGGFNVKVLVKDDGAELKIRRKGQQEILGTRMISPKEKIQNVTYYFDGNKIFTKEVFLNIKGYSGADEIEFVIDNKVLVSGSGVINTRLGIGIEANQKRELQIRKKGTTTALMSKEITTEQTAAPLVFFYDGIKIHDKIDLAIPVNPANMIVNASFTNKVGVYQGPVDLIFYKGQVLTPRDQFTPTTLRLELPADGSFSKNIELPPLPESGDFNKWVYTYRIVKRGTLTDLPYNTINEFQPVSPTSFYNGDLSFTAGGTSIFSIWDYKIVDDWDGTFFLPNMVDIAPYFK